MRAFDINEPGSPNNSVVLNHKDGSQSLGTPEEFQELKAKGELNGVHTEPKLEAPSEPQVNEEVQNERGRSAGGNSRSTSRRTD